MRVYRTNNRVLSVYSQRRIPCALAGEVSDGAILNLRIVCATGSFVVTSDNGPGTGLMKAEVAGDVLIATTWVYYEPRLHIRFGEYRKQEVDRLVGLFEEWRKNNLMVIDSVTLHMSEPRKTKSARG